MNLKMREKLLGDLTDFFTGLPDQKPGEQAEKNVKLEITSAGEDGDEFPADEKLGLLEKAAMKGC